MSKEPEELKVYVADFETTTEVDYAEEGCVRVYLWHIRDINENDVAVGYDIESFMDWIEHIKKKDKVTVWFHNLSFDGSYIVSYALEHGWTSETFKEVKDRKDGKNAAESHYLTENDLPKYYVNAQGNRVKTGIPRAVVKAYDIPRHSLQIIKAASAWITLTLYNRKGSKITICDSGNKFTGLGDGVDSQGHQYTGKSLAAIAALVGMEKTDLDVHTRRPLGTPVTEEEITRVKTDTLILARAMKLWYEWGMTKPTLAADAWTMYRQMFISKHGKDEWEMRFPDKGVEIFKFKDGTEVNIRDAYYGGRVYLRPQYADKDLKNVSSIDCNSMHPSQMRYKPMPWGLPSLSFNRPASDLYIVHFHAKFDLRPGKDPVYQRKGSVMSQQVDWVYHSDAAGEDVTITNIDLKMFLDAYELELPFETYDRYYVNFPSVKEYLFNDYIDHWKNEKIKNKKLMKQYEKGSAEYMKYNILYYRAKIMQNALYGKFGQDPIKPYQWGEMKDDVLSIKQSSTDKGEYFQSLSCKYLPVAVFITAWSRKTLNDVWTAIPTSVYCDTDADYFIDPSDGDKSKTIEYLTALGIDIDDTELGKWDVEHVKEPIARFLRPKTYIIKQEDGGLFIRCGGMPAVAKNNVTFDDFHPGAEYEGKLLPKMVKGGKLLRETTYKIKGESLEPTVKDMKRISRARQEQDKMNKISMDTHACMEDARAYLEDACMEENDCYWKRHTEKAFIQKKWDEFKQEGL